eukprot:CAMPEP_0119300936 /NCGR_PEP_ID=MMETSP1333-20130426/2815_1 /TAXON_ID=418940 /ORGANISM="Scyphosphaera apsteinii, Strain RCC1455" /LENGTH=451 /DNA_ID=CAMNT_0007302875 /DNA_START=307 /DNA_END=1662 /DNA_ORIENTATION=-
MEALFAQVPGYAGIRQARGLLFVDFESIKAATSAMMKLQGHSFDGQSKGLVIDYDKDVGQAPKKKAEQQATIEKAQIKNRSADYYCYACGTKALKTRGTLLTELPTRSTDSAAVLDEHLQLDELLLLTATTPVSVRRTKGVERQLRLTCRSCSEPLAYRSAVVTQQDAPQYLYVHQELLSLGQPPMQIAKASRQEANNSVHASNVSRGRQSALDARQRSQPYAGRPVKQGCARNPEQEFGEEELKANGSTAPGKLAEAICKVAREIKSNNMPGVMATGPAAIHQAIKAIALARQFLLEERPPIELQVYPKFEQDLREGSEVCLQLSTHRRVVQRQTMESDLSAKEDNDLYKVAAAITTRLRDDQEVSVTAQGNNSVLLAVKAIALAQEYLNNHDSELTFVVQFRKSFHQKGARPPPHVGAQCVQYLEPQKTSGSYLHFAILSTVARRPREL